MEQIFSLLRQPLFAASVSLAGYFYLRVRRPEVTYKNVAPLDYLLRLHLIGGAVLFTQFFLFAPISLSR